MNWEDFDAHFDRFTSTVFRLETLQYYAGEDARLRPFREGLPLPERSVRTSPWLARIAVSTATQGKRWGRVRVVEEPLTEYTRYEMTSYAESQAAGEEIRIAVRSGPGRRLWELRRDFWLFDYGMPQVRALLLDYTPAGEWQGGQWVTDAMTLVELGAERDLALARSVPLNEYLAQIARQAA